MIKKLNNFLFHDIGWKIFALLSAVLLWYVVLNIENPMQKQSVYKALQLQNEDILRQNGFAIMNKDQLNITVRLNVQGKRSDMSRIYNQSPYVNAYIDLKTIDASYSSRIGDPIPLPINADVPPPSTVESKDPESIKIFIDELATKTMPVTVNIIGTVKENYEEQPAQFTQTAVEISAPQSVLDTVKSVETNVNIKNMSQDVVVNDAELVAYDSDHKEMTSKVSLNVHSINVTVPVYPIKSIPVQARIEGSPQRGYYVSGVSVEPATAEIVGRQSELDLLDAIQLDPVNLDNLTKDKVQVFDLTNYTKDKRITMRRDSVSHAEVTVHVEKETVEQISLPVRNISVIQNTAQMSVDLPQNDILFSVRGPAAAISKINPDTLKADLDVSGLGEGVQKAPLKVQLPQNVEVAGGPIMVQVIIHLPEEGTPGDNVTEASPSAGSPASVSPAETSDNP